MKNKLTYLFILIAISGFTQKSDSVLFNKIINIESVVTKHFQMDSTNKTNIITIQKLQNDIVEIQRNLNSAKQEKEEYKVENDKIKENLKAAIADINTLKPVYKNIIDLLKNENSTFNPEIIKILKNNKNLSEAENKTLNDFVKLCDTIAVIRKYINEEAYKETTNSNYYDITIKLLGETRLKFDKIYKELENYKDLLSRYCLATKYVGITFEKIDKYPTLKDDELTSLQYNYFKFGYLNMLIEKAFNNEKGYVIKDYPKTCPTK